MKRSSAIAGSGVALVVVLVLGLVLLKEDPRKNGTAPGKGATITPRWNLPPLKTEKPAVPTPRGKIELPALPAARDAISGFVKDVKGSPIAAATVALLGDEKCSARTAADGAFNLVPTLAGKKLILYASGPAPFAPRVIPGVAPGTAGLVIVLGAGEATVQGRVVRANDQKPVANAKLEASTGDWLGRATTDASGRFTLAGAPSGALGLVVSAENLIPRVVTVNVARGAGPDIEIALQPGVKLTGTVVEKGALVPNARVILKQGGVPLPFERRETKSDANGRFVFEGLPPAECHVHARAERGISPIVVVRADGAHDPDPVTLELGPAGSLAGRVSCDGAPVPGAKLSVADEDAPAPLAATSDAQGRFAIEPVTPGVVFEIQAEAKGFARKKLGVSSEEAVDIVLSRAAILVVTCVPPAQEIEIEGADGDRRLLQWGGVVDDLSAGTTWVVAKNPGRAPSSKRVELKEGETTRVDLDLKAGSTLEGTCTSDDGGPVAGASVVATDPASGPIGATSAATSDAEGRFKLADLAPGTHRIVAIASGFVEAEAEVADGTRTVALTLARSHGLEVQVTIPPRKETPPTEDHHSHAQHGAILVKLEAKGGKEPPHQRVVNAEGTAGSAVFDRLRGQTYVVTVASPGLAPAKVEVDPRTQKTVAVTLEAGAECTGVVLDAEGKPLHGAAISRGHDANEDLMQEASFATLLGMTEEKGEFHCDIAPGGEDVTVTHPEHAPLFTKLVPGKGVKLTLAPGSRIVGRALSKDGQPQPGIGVVLEGPVEKRTETGPDGAFSFKGLLAGSYRVKRHDSAPEAPGVEVSVGNRGESSVDLRAP
ncbi:MAG: carboxypeptidase regulatory-like domain-containing protein [Planctomycetota bacterium]